MPRLGGGLLATTLPRRFGGDNSEKCGNLKFLKIFRALCKFLKKQSIVVVLENIMYSLLVFGTFVVRREALHSSLINYFILQKLGLKTFQK